MTCAMRSLLPWVASASLLACSGGSKPQRDAQTERAAKAEAPPAKAEAAPASEPTSSEPPAGQSLADRRDPEWFHPGLLPDAKVVKSGRTEADERGLFSSQILYALPEGATTESCVETLTKKLEPHGISLSPMPGQEGKGGRVSLAGDTDSYRATVVCGEAKGTVRAYVGYQWLK